MIREIKRKCLIIGANITSSQQAAGKFKCHSKHSKEREKFRQLQQECRTKYEGGEITAENFLCLVATKFKSLSEEDADDFYLQTEDEIRESLDELRDEDLDGILQPWERREDIWDSCGERIINYFNN